MVKAEELQLLEFERGIGVAMPCEYRKYLLTDNGKNPKKTIFKINSEEGESRIDEMYGLHNGPEYRRLDKAYQTFSGRIHANLIPIASDSFGNQVCLSVRGANAGKIYFWDHEVNIVSDLDSLIEIASGFDDFVMSLMDDVSHNLNEVEQVIVAEGIEPLKALLSSGYDIKSLDKYSRTILERAVIKNRVDIVEYLHSVGAELRKAKEIAKDNYRFFPEFKEMIDLINRLES